MQQYLSPEQEVVKRVLILFKRFTLTLSSYPIWFPLVLSALCFLPVLLGLNNGSIYPDGFLVNSSKYDFTASVLASLCTLPITIDTALDKFLTVWRRRYRGKSTDQTITDINAIYIPFYETIFYLVIPDILFLLWIVSQS